MNRNKHTGARNEMIACAWLIGQGYEVFRNVSAHGEVDVIGTKDGAIFLFDVKHVYMAKSGPASTNRLSQAQIDRGVKIIRVADGVCEIDWNPLPKGLRRVERQCERCQTPFIPNHGRQRFCGSNCRVYSNLGINPVPRVMKRNKRALQTAVD